MLKKNKYLIISSILTVIIGILFIILLFASLQSLELILDWIQLGCLLIALGIMIDYIRKDKDNLFYQLQIGAVVCFVLGQIFWAMHLLILGYDNNSFGISDISWIGFYLFLLSGVSSILSQTVKKKLKVSTKIKIIALIAPVMIITTSILQYLYYVDKTIGGILYVMLYTAVMAPLSYYSFLLMIIPYGENTLLKALRPYNAVVLALLTTDVVWTFSEFQNHGILFSACEFILSILFLLLASTAYGGDSKWKAC